MAKISIPIEPRVRVENEEGDLRFLAKPLTSAEVNVLIDDLVEIKEFGSVYPTFEDAYLFFWGTDYDGFHYNGRRDTLGNVKRSVNGLYGNRWRVLNMALHPDERTVLLHLKDGMGRNLVIAEKAVKLIKRSPNARPPEILKRIIER